ncbi:MAG: redoxin domain-containing protein [Thermoleophilia bacterium]
MSVLPAGSDVPEFTLRREDGKPFTREDLAGRTTVLVFYPAAFSSVCTDQFQIYEEVLDDLAAQGATVYGVSIDQTDSQVAFRESVGTSIPMLSDAVPQAATAKAFGAFFEPTGVANRALVIVNPDLRVQWSWEGEHPGILPGANLIFDGLAAGHA